MPAVLSTSFTIGTIPDSIGSYFRMEGKCEVELVDMVLRIRSKLDDARLDLPLPDIIRERLERHVDTILRTLPDDLRGVLGKKRNFLTGTNSVEAMGAGPADENAATVSERKSEERTVEAALCK